MTPDEISKLIPDEVVEAAMKGFEEAYEQSLNNEGEQHEPEQWMRAALASALTAWPVQCSDVDAKGRDVLMLVFPLTQKDKSDE